MDRRKLQSAMLVLTLLGALLVLPPLVMVFNQPISHWGLPQIVIYLFVVWLLLIGGTALLSHRMPPEAAENQGEAD
jgi:hypothetical protein